MRGDRSLHVQVSVGRLGVITAVTFKIRRNQPVERGLLKTDFAGLASKFMDIQNAYNAARRRLTRQWPLRPSIFCSALGERDCIDPGLTLAMTMTGLHRERRGTGSARPYWCCLRLLQQKPMVHRCTEVTWKV